MYSDETMNLLLEAANIIIENPLTEEVNIDKYKEIAKNVIKLAIEAWNKFISKVKEKISKILDKLEDALYKRHTLYLTKDLEVLKDIYTIHPIVIEFSKNIDKITDDDIESGKYNEVERYANDIAENKRIIIKAGSPVDGKRIVDNFKIMRESLSEINKISIKKPENLARLKELQYYAKNIILTYEFDMNMIMTHSQPKKIDISYDKLK